MNYSEKCNFESLQGGLLAQVVFKQGLKDRFNCTIGLFKMFSRWIWGVFSIQIQSDRGHKLMLFMFQNKDKDLLGIYQYGGDPFCVSLLTDRHLKVRSNSILFTFSDKGALTSARDS